MIRTSVAEICASSVDLHFQEERALGGRREIAPTRKRVCPCDGNIEAEGQTFLNVDRVKNKTLRIRLPLKNNRFLQFRVKANT